MEVGAKWRHVRAVGKILRDEESARGKSCQPEAYERLGEPMTFHLLFDAVNNRIGVEPMVPEISNAYRVAKYEKNGDRVVKAWRLMEEFGIDLPGTIRFDSADIDQEGVLVLNPRTVKVSARSVAQMRKALVEMNNSN